MGALCGESLPVLHIFPAAKRLLITFDHLHRATACHDGHRSTEFSEDVSSGLSAATNIETSLQP